MKDLKYIFLVIFSVGFFACDEELLNVDNTNELTEEQFWQTGEDAQQGLNAVFSMNYKPGLWSRWIYFRFDLTSDIGYSKSPWIELADWTRFQYINYNFDPGNVETWRDSYKAIYRCNQVLAFVPEIDMDDTEKALIIGQAKFFRAFYYYNIAMLWEDAPLVLEPSTPEDVPAKNTYVEILAQVALDLNDAESVLPDQWDDANTGRPTKGAANAFLARTFMQQHMWDEAKSALDYFFTGSGSGVYSLASNFKDNFTHLNENNSESVFEIQFSDANFGGNSSDDPNQSMGTNRAQFFAPGGIGWSDGQVRHWVVDAFKQEADLNGNIDERLRHSIFYSDIEADFGDLIYNRTWQWGAEDAYFRKYQRDYYRDNEDYDSQVNLRMVRFAEILLSYAEVLNELGQTSTAYSYVDQVRARANMAPLATAYPAIGNDSDLFLERLKTERLLELCGESTRWTDLKRWGDLDTQASVDEIALRDPDFLNFDVGVNHRLPIPQIDVENNSNLEQHDNY